MSSFVTPYPKEYFKENLIDQNEEAVNLIHEYAGEIVRPDFRKGRDKFIDHALILLDFCRKIVLV